MSIQAKYLTFLSLGPLVCSFAHADADEGWKTSISAGASFNTNQQLLDSGSGSIANLGAIDPTLNGNAGAATIKGISTRDAFSVGPAVSLELSKLMDSNAEPFVRLRYTDLKGRNQPVGSISNFSNGTSSPIQADFDDLKSTALDFGARYNLVNSGNWIPFVGGYVGATRTSALKTAININSPLYSAESLTLVPSNTRLDTGVEAGVGVKLNDVSEIKLSVGANYLDAKNMQSPLPQQFGLTQVSAVDPRWSVPASIGVALHF